MAKAPKVDEKVFKDHVAAALCRIPRTRSWVQNSGVARGVAGGEVLKLMPKGAADVGAAINVGHYAAWVQVECKMPRGRRTPEQVAWAYMVEHIVGGIYHLAVYDPKVDVETNAARVRDAVLAELERRVAAASAAAAAPHPEPAAAPPGPAAPPTVGAVLWRDFMPGGMGDVAELAWRGDLDADLVQALVTHRARLDAPTAAKLAQATGTTPEFWLEIQTAHDAHAAGAAAPA